MTDQTNEYWEKFFTDAGISDEFVSTYASIFMENRIPESRLSGIDYALLKYMGITAGGDLIAIVEHVKKIGKEKRDDSSSFLKSSEDNNEQRIVVLDAEFQTLKNHYEAKEAEFQTLKNHHEAKEAEFLELKEQLHLQSEMLSFIYIGEAATLV